MSVALSFVNYVSQRVTTGMRRHFEILPYFHAQSRTDVISHVVV